MDVSYKQALIDSMQILEEDPKRIFLGYNVAFGSQAYGTLRTIQADRKLETPVAENLMTGLAIGLAMTGFRPVLFFERHDFIPVALDAIVNHMDKMKTLADINLPIIIRANVGSQKPLYPGIQHTQDFTDAFKHLVHFPVYDARTPKDVIRIYDSIKSLNSPVMVVERRDLYDLK